MRTILESRLSPVRDKLRRLQAELGQGDLSLSDRGLVVAQRAVNALGLGGRVALSRHVVFELREAPPLTRSLRGLRDLVVRRGDLSDLEALQAVDGREPALLRRRFSDGDLAFVGQTGGRVLCHVFFHRGPRPFEEDLGRTVALPLERDTFWSYDAAADRESRASGVFIKVFQAALQSLFREQGAERVLCMVQHTNQPSLRMHEHLGFRRLGTLTALALPLGKLLRWEATDGSARSFLLGAAEVPAIHASERRTARA